MLLFGARRWLVLCMAVFLAVSALLYGSGHALAYPSGEAHPAAQDVQLRAGVDHGLAASCDDQNSGDRECRDFDMGCGICAPLPAAASIDFTRNEIAGITRLPALAPAGLQQLLRPPRLSVSA